MEIWSIRLAKINFFVTSPAFALSATHLAKNTRAIEIIAGTKDIQTRSVVTHFAVVEDVIAKTAQVANVFATAAVIASVIASENTTSSTVADAAITEAVTKLLTAITQPPLAFPIKKMLSATTLVTT
jgi:hypothetical protein